MPRAQDLDLINRFYNEMWNQFDKSLFAAILEPTIRFHGSLGQENVGYDEFGDYVDYIKSFAPDFHNAIVSKITEGDQTFVRLRFTGTHRGEVFGIAPTGRSNTPVLRSSQSPQSEVWVFGDIYGLIQTRRRQSGPSATPGCAVRWGPVWHSDRSQTGHLAGPGI